MKPVSSGEDQAETSGSSGTASGRSSGNRKGAKRQPAKNKKEGKSGAYPVHTIPSKFAGLKQIDLIKKLLSLI